MKRGPLAKQLLHILVAVSFVTSLLVPSVALADNGKGNDNKSSTTTSQPPGQAKKDTSAPASTSNGNQPAGASNQTRGQSGSNPDGGGVDKPYAAAGQPANSQAKPSDTTQVSDGNNGCGQDKKADADRETGTLHTGYDDNNGWCGKPHEKVTSPPPPPGEVRGTSKEHVVGCYEWKDSGERFFIDEDMSEGQAKQFDRDTNKVGDTMESCKTEQPAPPPPPPAPQPVHEVHIEGCFKDMGHVDITLPEDQAKVFEDTHERIPCAGVQGTVEEHVKIWVCHRTGSMTNPYVLVHVSANAEGHLRTDSHDQFDLHPEDIVFGENLPANFVLETFCHLPQLPTGSNNPPAGGNNNPPPLPPPPPPGGTLGTTDVPQPDLLYGCFRTPAGDLTFINGISFETHDALLAYVAQNGLTVQAQLSSPENCEEKKSETPPQGPPPAEQHNPGPPENPGNNPNLPENPGNPNAPENPNPPGPPSIPPGQTLGIVSEEGNPPQSLMIDTSVQTSQPSVITTTEARDQSPVVDIFPPAGQLGIVSEQPSAFSAAPVSPEASSPAAAPVNPITTILPITGEPLVSLGLITLALLGITLLGMRMLRASARRA